MNWLAFPTLLLGLAAFGLGCRWARQPFSRFQLLATWFVLGLLAVPGLAYAAYYSKLFGEPIWLYQVRAWPGSELLAAPAGLLAGFLHMRLIPRLQLSRLGARFGLVFLFTFGLLLPYLKPVLRPLRAVPWQDRWEDGVCMQSTASTCGPATAATILRLCRVRTTERELARESFSCGTGTENWYLARALRRRGLQVEFVGTANLPPSLPALVGVKLPAADNAGHFIALLWRNGKDYIVADPMIGRFTNTLAELRTRYEFTGLYMTLRPTVPKSG